MLIVYASPVIVKLQVRQAHIPALFRLNRVEPHDGHLRVLFRLFIIRAYLFLTVEPYFAPNPRSEPDSEELDKARDTSLYLRSNFFSFKFSGTGSEKYLLR